MVLVDLSSAGANWAIVNTASDAQDTGGAAGFSIQNNGAYRGRGTSLKSLTNYNDARKIAIRGYANVNPPKVTGVKISSTPSLDVDGDNTAETYGLGEKIQVQATFDKNVTVTGTPRLKIDFSSEAWGEKWAAYASGSGTKVLTFSYTVVTPNISTQGIAVLENTLALNGGTIKDADSVDATLTHTGLAHNAAHKVNSGLQPANAPKSPASPAAALYVRVRPAAPGAGRRHDAGDPAGGHGGRRRSLHLCADLLAGGPRGALLRCGRRAPSRARPRPREAGPSPTRPRTRTAPPRYCPSG